MPAKLQFAPEVEQDLDDAYDWYERQREGLGEEFLECVDTCLESIRLSPEMHPVVYRGYRRALVQRFPFSVFYEYQEGKVTIHSVFNTYRNPARWRKRLRK